jgi:subtilisin family serine protease
MASLSTATRTAESPIIAAEPERIVFAIELVPSAPDDTGSLADIAPFDLDLMEQTAPVPQQLTLLRPLSDVSVDYLRGYRDSVNSLVDQLTKTRDTTTERELEAEAVWNETQVTWGLQATRVANSQFSGRGVKVAVLDTGFGPHQDFTGRSIVMRSFIAGQSPADGHSHGTHCIGTACGARRPRTLPRYGIAYDSDIMVGKVLSNSGSGTDGGILAGINWAVLTGARVVSMSLGASVTAGTSPSAVFEGVARRALARGTLIIAAAGNDSHRPAIIRPVSHPANVRSILAVGALDENLRVASFHGALNPNGGEVNIAAPNERAVQCTVPTVLPPLRGDVHGHATCGWHRCPLCTGDRARGSRAVAGDRPRRAPPDDSDPRRRGRSRTGALTIDSYRMEDQSA